MNREVFGRIEAALAWVGGAWIALGLLLRLTTVRDRFYPLAVVFFTTPWPAIAGGLAYLAWHLGRRRSRAWGWSCALLSLATLGVWFALSWRMGADANTAPDLRVALWNCARPPAGRFAHQAEWLRAQNADFIAIAEAEHHDDPRDWAGQFPEYHVERLPLEMLCLIRGDLLSREDGILAEGSEYGLLRVRIKGEELTVIQADIYGAPLTNRRPALTGLAAVVHAHAGERLIMLGDFNTPRESVLFDPFRRELTHAFEASGRGSAETWPIPLPVLALDHLWCSAKLRPLRTEITWTPWSDHRPVVADFAKGP